MKTVTKTLQTEKDRRWRSKGGAHKDKTRIPTVCPTCNGMGVIYINGGCYTCEVCSGIGEVDEH